jgi:hypothetical protein
MMRTAIIAAALIGAAVALPAAAGDGHFSGSFTGPHGGVTTFERDYYWDREAGAFGWTGQATFPNGDTRERFRDFQRLEPGAWAVQGGGIGRNGNSWSWSGLFERGGGGGDF